MNTSAIRDAILSHAMASGQFDRVQGHEPKSAPGNGVSAFLWANRLRPYARTSGLAATDAVVIYSLRLQMPMLTEPEDDIDPTLMDAADALMAAYSADFDLGSSARNIDLLGQSGTALETEYGYLEHDRKMFRVAVITIPVIVNDAWSQAA